MRCTLVDTGALVGLLDERDGNHKRALAELVRAPEPRLLCTSVITEALHLMDRRGHARIARALDGDVVQVPATPSWESLARRALRWMRDYEDHEPAFNDAFLIAWYEKEPGARVWTFDSEFRTTWRTSKGKPVKLVE